jgi:hypothetical protein
VDGLPPEIAVTLWCIYIPHEKYSSSFIILSKKIFIDDRSTINKNTTLVQRNVQHIHYWTSVLSLAILLPVWIAWMMFYSFFILPVQLCRVQCEVRRYWIRQERGEHWFSQTPIDDNLLEPGETTRLLSEGPRWY